MTTLLTTTSTSPSSPRAKTAKSARPRPGSSSSSPSSPLPGSQVSMACVMQAMDDEAKSTFRETGEFTMQVICEGMNLNKDYDFTREALKQGAKVFSRAQIVSGHPGPWEDPFARDPQRLIGFIKQAKFNAKGMDGKACIEATAVITNEDARENMANLSDAGGADQIEFSILASVKAKEQIQGERRWYVVEEFVKCYSVDHVLRGAAGGKVCKMSLEDQNFNDDSNHGEPLMTPEQIQDMIAENATLKQNLATAQTETQSALAKVKDAEDKLAAQAKEVLDEKIKTVIQSSTLPDASKTRLSAQTFASIEAAQSAITAEADYIKSLGVTAQATTDKGADKGADNGTPSASKVVGMGVTNPATPTAPKKDPAPIAQSYKDDPAFKTAFDRYCSQGLSIGAAERAAKIAVLA